MRALVLEEYNGLLVMKDVPVPTISPHEVLVRVSNVGVCGTDLKIRAGRMGLDALPLIMGHEVGGEVAEVGSEIEYVAPGDRVAVQMPNSFGYAVAAFGVPAGRVMVAMAGHFASDLEQTHADQAAAVSTSSDGTSERNA